MLRIEKASLPTLITRLSEEALAVGRAELQLAKSKLQYHLSAMRTPVLLFVIALIIGLDSIVALFLGFVLALVPYVGALLAGLIVLVAGLVVAGMLGWIGARLLTAHFASREKK